MHVTEDLIEGYSLNEAVTKYAEIAKQAEERMAQMEAKFEEKFSMITIHQPHQQSYFQHLPPMPRI